MEVHHHAHPSTGSGTSKKWTHYFWEFLMLFLAVFCGFLAENYREHKVEHLRAREFARSLIKELKADTFSIHYHDKYVSTYINNVDTLMNLSRNRLEGADATKFSFYTRFAYWTTGVAWHRTTFEQVKSSGTLRYFDHDLVEKLLDYDSRVAEIQYEVYNNEVRGNQLINLINKIVDPAYHQEVSKLLIWNLDTLSNAAKERYFAVPTGSLENKREVINEFLNMAVVQQRNLKRRISQMALADSMASELIPLFRDAYHIKD